MLDFGEAGEVYNVGGPEELPNIDVVKKILELAGRDESLIDYVEGSARPRPPLLARVGATRRPSAGSRRFSSTRGIERTVEWYRENEWWWSPIRSGEYREYYERQYGRSLG